MLFCECGTGSFKHVDEDSEDLGCTGGGSPRERRKHGGGKVNPYAERGLDRFSVVLSELETRRAKILRRVGSDTGLVLVRFVQSNGDWTPVVFKLPEEPPPPSKKKAAGATKNPRAAAASSPPPAPASPRSPLEHASPREREGASSSATTAKVVATSKTKVPARKASFSWGRGMRRPSRYWPSVIVLTLVSLAVFGRVFAICLASIWWYVLPTLGSGDGEDARRGPAGMRMSMEKKKAVSPALPHPHARRGSTGGVYEVVRSPKGKRG